MKILVLGGTQFSGRAFVEQANGAGHDLTVLHRSEADPGLPKSVRRLIGDRDPDKGGGLGEIQRLIENGERFDAVVDMCGYVPRVVSASCELLKDHTNLYLFVSSVSVYQEKPEGGIDEDSPVIELEDPSVEEVTGETYGGLKVLCERVVQSVFSNRACIVRPGLIVGPNDPTDRFTWWVRMLSSADRVLIPKEPAGLASFIDARDLAGFFMSCVENATGGIFNAEGPEPRFGLREMIDRAKAALGSDAQLVEAEHEWLKEQEVQPWGDIPVWLPAESQWMHRASSARAIGAGLKIRPIEDTVRDTHSWDVERGLPKLKAGLTADRMIELLNLL